MENLLEFDNGDFGDLIPLKSSAVVVFSSESKLPFSSRWFKSNLSIFFEKSSHSILDVGGGWIIWKSIELWLMALWATIDRLSQISGRLSTFMSDTILAYNSPHLELPQHWLCERKISHPELALWQKCIYRKISFRSISRLVSNFSSNATQQLICHHQTKTHTQHVQSLLNIWRDRKARKQQYQKRPITNHHSRPSRAHPLHRPEFIGITRKHTNTLAHTKLAKVVSRSKIDYGGLDSLW